MPGGDEGEVGDIDFAIVVDISQKRDRAGEEHVVRQAVRGRIERDDLGEGDRVEVDDLLVVLQPDDLRRLSSWALRGLLNPQGARRDS